MRKFIRIICIIIFIVIVMVVIYNNNLTIEQKIGSNQINVLGFEKRDVSDLQRYAIQEGFEYVEHDAGYQFSNFLRKEYNEENSICTEYKESIVYDGSPNKIEYTCESRDTLYIYVYDFESNSWYTNENYTEDERDFYFKDYGNQIDTPSKEQEVFDKEFKYIHEKIKNGVKELEDNGNEN